jgi:putative oxidoreductase
MLASKCEKYAEYGPLLLRVVLGISMVFHGYGKFFGDDGIAGTAGYFASVGIPGIFAYLVATLELVGGALLIVGVLSRLIAALLAVQFVVILLLKLLPTKMKASGFDGTGGIELDLFILAAAVVIAVGSAGKLSLERILFKKELV